MSVLNRFRFFLRMLPYYFKTIPADIHTELKNIQFSWKFRFSQWHHRWRMFIIKTRRTARELKWSIFDLWYKIKDFPGKTKRRIWNKRILLTWNRLWIRKDEFDRSLNMDVNALLEMNDEEREHYVWDLIRRRQIAHDRDLVGMDAKLGW